MNTSYRSVAVCVGDTVENVISIPMNSRGTTTQISLQSLGQMPWKAFGMAVAFVWLDEPVDEITVVAVVVVSITFDILAIINWYAKLFWTQEQFE